MLPGLTGIVGFNSEAAGGGAAPYGTHSWWRLIIDEGDTGDASTNVVNLQFRTTPSGSHTAGTAFAGGAGVAGGGTLPADAFLGSTYQRSADSAWWIGCQYGSPTSIVEMNLKGGAIRGRCVIKARLQYSDDSTTGSDGTWTDAFSIYDPVYGVTEDQVWPQDLTGASGYKAYRFQWTATPTTNRTILAELEMLASAVDKATSGKARVTVLGVTVDAPNVCDDNSTTEIASTTSSAGAVTLSMVVPVLIDSYSVTSGSNAARAPRDWTVAGTNDGTTFTTLSTKTGETFATTQLKKTYSI